MAGDRTISFPFRIGSNNAIVTVDSDSRDAEIEAVAQLILTRPGERVLVPAFGMPDPTFSTLNPAELQAGLDMFGPDVKVTDLVVAYPNRSTELVELTIQ